MLASLRSFPSLEPIKFVALPTEILDVPLRRDLLWKASVYEADCARVGSSNPPGRSDKGYSRHKLRPQKGTGKARLGDANSPMLVGGGVALARTAPNDFSTELPFKVYCQAFKIALSHLYRSGNLIIVGDKKLKDGAICDFVTKSPQAGKKFLDAHDFNRKRIVFVVDEPRENLMEATSGENISKRIDIIQKEGIQVRDLLKANRLIIELPALKYLSNRYLSKL